MVQHHREQGVRRIRNELETGGNVRFESGTPVDTWYQSTAEMLMARFDTPQFEQFGIKGARVLSVERIHNRFLRSRADELQAALDDSENAWGVTGKVQYFFLVAEDVATQDKSVQEGFDDRPGKVVLTESVSHVVLPRLQNYVDSAVGQALVARAASGDEEARAAWSPSKAGDALRKGSVRFPAEQVTVWSLWLPEETTPDSPRTFDPSRPVGQSLSDHPPFRSERDGQSAIAVVRHARNDPNKRVWIVRQPELLVPVYSITFDFLYASDSGDEESTALGIFASPLRSYRLWLGAPEENGGKDKGGDDTLLAEDDRPLADSRGTTIALLRSMDVQASLNMVAKSKRSADASRAEEVTALDFHGRGIRRIEPNALAGFKQLRTLLLSFNSIELFSCIPSIPTLTALDLSFNLLQKIDRLESFPELKTLDLAWNSLFFVEDTKVLARHLPKLQNLSMLGNNITEAADYRSVVLRSIPGLARFDDRDVAASEVQDGVHAADRGAAALDQVLLAGAIAVPPGRGSPADPFRGVPVQQLLDPPKKRRDLQITWENWRSQTLALVLVDRGLSEVVDLLGFSKLRAIDLSRNKLTTLVGIPLIFAVQVLVVEENWLTSLQGIAESFPNLEYLHAGGNRVSDGAHLRGLTKLVLLSLEDNYVDTFDGFADAYNLVELYLSNNLVEEIRATLVLKALPKLLVLDLSGNELTKAAEYRSYCIFHLRRLKVLDGEHITAAESTEAKDRFSGRLTIELLEEKIGPAGVCYSFRSVNLSGCRLKDIGQFLTEDFFPSIRELNLEDNQLTSIGTIGPLGKLLVLKLNRNRIDFARGLGDAEGTAATGLRALTNLQVLELGGNHVVDAEPLGQYSLPNLRVLHLAGNELTRVTGVGHLEQLRELVLDRNKIRMLEEKSVQGLKSLRELHMEDNALRSLANFGPLPRLRAVFLALNRVADFAEIEKLKDLCYLCSCPCSKTRSRGSRFIALISFGSCTEYES
jgi:Leucine-rich repeat (LRR) protein